VKNKENANNEGRHHKDFRMKYKMVLPKKSKPSIKKYGR
jgi:hypothetical protein